MKSLKLMFNCLKIWRSIKFFSPCIWPKKLQIRIYFALCIIFLIFDKFAKVYTSIYSKLIVDSFNSSNNEDLTFRWDLICIYFLLKYCEEIDAYRHILWSMVKRKVMKEIEVHVYLHIQNRSLRWHLKRKTGEVLKILDSSSESVIGLIELVIFSILPTMVDVSVSVGYFTMVFDFWYGVTLLVCMALYSVVSYNASWWDMGLRIEKYEAASNVKNRCIDSLLNFETVKYFGNEKYEVNSFRKAVENLNTGELKSMLLDTSMQSLQNFITELSLLIGSLLCAYRVVKSKDMTAGDYIMFSTYVTQLYQSVDSISYIYRAILASIMNIEHLIEFLKEEEEILDPADGKELEVAGGMISFRNVFFEYLPNHPILKNISFDVPSGHTVAIVGPSGSGKSTIVRLLFRFYDVSFGFITIDGQNIKEVTQESLRKAIGVVPQDIVLFNDTIGYNIKYGKLSADEEEVIEAAKGADIHKNILAFKDDYNTQVGERGLRLSGGEKQRIAIARTVLKAPQIIILDEATSSLDTQTERNIQESLQKLCASKTTIIIAHRLSTIVHADQILVLKEGTVVERGRHEDLLEIDQIYASMWNQQLSSMKDKKKEN